MSAGPAVHLERVAPWRPQVGSGGARKAASGGERGRAMAGAGGDKGRMVGPRATAGAGGAEGGVAVGAGGEEGRCMTAPVRRPEREGRRRRSGPPRGGWSGRGRGRGGDRSRKGDGRSRRERVGVGAFIRVCAN